MNLWCAPHHTGRFIVTRCDNVVATLDPEHKSAERSQSSNRCFIIIR